MACRRAASSRRASDPIVGCERARGRDPGPSAFGFDLIYVVTLTLALPALPERAVTLSPPSPPLPPVALTSTTFTAAPVSPDVAWAADVAPELAEETAVPTALASPVGPESP